MNPLLKSVSFLNQTGCRIKDLLYRKGVFHPREVPVPVISVGNIQLGGSEKTPLVMNLLSFFLEQEKKPALVTRGYKSLWERRGGILSDGRSILGDWKSAGDEPYMVAKRLPAAGIFVGKNRYLSCMKAVESGFDILVLDDGFQHLRLKRNLDIVLHITQKKNPLRESYSALRRAHILLVRSLESVSQKNTLIFRLPNVKIFGYNVTCQGIYPAGGEDPISVESLFSKRLIAFSGIAHPRRFFSLLSEIGIQPLKELDFPDHHFYPESTQNVLREQCIKNQAEALITTEKDIHKILGSPSLEGIPLYWLKIDLDIEKAFYQEILERL